MRSVIITVAGAMALAGCGGQAARSPGMPPASPVADGTPPGLAVIGASQTISGPDAEIKATVYHVQDFNSRAEFGNPSKRYIGADVRVCFDKVTEASAVGTMPWSIIYSDDTGAQPIGEWWNGEFSVPLYPEGRKLASGQCARGWIMFTPLKGKPVRVTYGPDEGGPVSWRIP